MIHSDQIDQLAAALAEAQADIKGAVKDSDNPFFKSKYADLGTVWDACRKQLTDNGLSVVQCPEIAEPGMIALTTTILHNSGQFMSATYAVQAKDASPQATGSAITYMRRYALSAMVGVPQIDDDAEGAEGRGDGQKQPYRAPAKPAKPAQPPAGALVTDAQRRAFVDLSQQHGWSVVQVKAHLLKNGVTDTAHILAAQYDDLMASLEQGPPKGDA